MHSKANLATLSHSHFQFPISNFANIHMLPSSYSFQFSYKHSAIDYTNSVPHNFIKPQDGCLGNSFSTQSPIILKLHFISSPAIIVGSAVGSSLSSLFVILPTILCIVIGCCNCVASRRQQTTGTTTTRPVSTTTTVVTTSPQQQSAQQDAYPAAGTDVKKAQPPPYEMATYPPQPAYPYPPQEVYPPPPQNVYSILGKYSLRLALWA